MGVEDVDKYDHLNIGQRRMSLGNRIRGRRKVIEVANAKLVEEAAKEDATKAQKLAAERVKSFEAHLEEVCKGPHKAREAREAEKAKAAKAKEAAKEKAAA
jgi:uncharacterized membrane protein YukC